MNDFHIDKLSSGITLLISLTYVLVTSFFAMLPSLLALRSLFGFALLTYFLGLSVRIFLRNVAKLSNLPSTISIGGLACDLLFSLLGSFAVGFVLIKVFLLIETFFVVVIIALIVILNLFTFSSLRRRKASSLGDASPQKGSLVKFLAPGIVLVVASILFASFFRNKTPFPTINGWDMNSSLAYINWIVSNKGYQYVLIPPFPSGVTPYPAFFFYLVSYYSLFLGVEPYSLFWVSIYPLILGYMFLVFLIALKFSKNIWLSIMSSFIAFFTSTASAEGVRNPLYLTLDMVSQIIFLLIICFNIHYDSHSIEKRIANITATIFLVLFNYYTAIAVFPFLLWIIMDNKKLPVIGDRWKAFRIGSVSMASFGSMLIALLSQTAPFASMLSPSVFPASLKIEMFQTIYPAYFWFLLGLALFSIAIYEKLYKQDKCHYPDLLLYALCGFILYFLPFGITYRLEFYFRVFLAIAISGIGLLLDRGFFAKIRISVRHKRLLNRKVSLGKLCLYSCFLSPLFKCTGCSLNTTLTHIYRKMSSMLQNGLGTTYLQRPIF